MSRLCRACDRGDCWDCVRILLETAGCDHRCSAERQLTLFSVLDVPARTSTRPTTNPTEDFSDVDW